MIQLLIITLPSEVLVPEVMNLHCNTKTASILTPQKVYSLIFLWLQNHFFFIKMIKGIIRVKRTKIVKSLNNNNNNERLNNYFPLILSKCNRYK